MSFCKSLNFLLIMYSQCTFIANLFNYYLLQYISLLYTMCTSVLFLCKFCNSLSRVQSMGCSNFYIIYLLIQQFAIVLIEDILSRKFLVAWSRHYFRIIYLCIMECNRFAIVLNIMIFRKWDWCVATL